MCAKSSLQVIHNHFRTSRGNCKEVCLFDCYIWKRILFSYQIRYLLYRSDSLFQVLQLDSIKGTLNNLRRDTRKGPYISCPVSRPHSLSLIIVFAITCTNSLGSIHVQRQCVKENSNFNARVRQLILNRYCL